jgi:hypothetical protein
MARDKGEIVLGLEKFKKAGGLRLDDFFFPSLHVLERNGGVFLPAFRGEPVQVHEIEARGEGGDLLGLESLVEEKLALRIEKP